MDEALGCTSALQVRILATKLELRPSGMVSSTNRLRMVTAIDQLRGPAFDPDATNSRTAFAFGIVVGAVVPLLLLALG